MFIIDQLDQETGNFDEHKVMLGFNSQEEATTAYQSNFDNGWKVGPIRTMDMEQFKNWLKNEDTSKPATAKNTKQSIENIRAEKIRKKDLSDMHNSVYGLASDEQLQESLKHLNKEIKKAQKQSENEVVNGKRSTRKAVVSGALDRFLKNRVDLETYIKARKNGELKQRINEKNYSNQNTNPDSKIAIKSESEIGQSHLISSFLVDQSHRLGDVVNGLASMRTEGVKANVPYAIKLLRNIAKLNPSVKIHIVSDLNKITDRSIRSNLSAGGFFVPDQNTSYIYPKSDAWHSSVLELLNHELVHAVTERSIFDGQVSQNNLNKLNEIIDNIKEYTFANYASLTEHVNDRLDYATTTNPIHEILAVGIAETQVRQALQSILGANGLQQLNSIFTEISTEQEKQNEQRKQNGNPGEHSKGNTKNVPEFADGITEEISGGTTSTETDRDFKRNTSNPSGNSSGNENSKNSNAQLDSNKDSEGEDQKLYSRSHTDEIGSTVQQVRDVLINHFGEKTINELERQGKLEIIQDYAVDGVEGFYYNGKAVLIASNLTPESAVPTFLHELGGHAGFQNMMN